VLATHQLVQIHLTKLLWCETQQTTCHAIDHEDL
jgi:hypothetical protein